MGVGRELYGQHRDGRLVPIEIGLNPVETPAGSFVLASITDVSERVHHEREAALQRNELAHLSRVAMLGELSGSLAHELNQPLAAILSNAQAALRFVGRPELMDELRETLADIVENDKRAGEVIRRLRAMLKKEEVKHRRLDLNELVSDVLRLYRSDLLNRKVAIVLELAPEASEVEGDPVQIQQVLLNLLINACDAMDGLSEGRRLTIRTRVAGIQDEQVEVSVSDVGKGIADGATERVFEAFVTSKKEGMGLGLAVCRTIIQAHHGRIWCDNNPGPGATFHFELARAEPRDQAPVPAHGEVQVRAPAGG
jgi:two-component system sensor kinase FixL